MDFNFADYIFTVGDFEARSDLPEPKGKKHAEKHNISSNNGQVSVDFLIFDWLMAPVVTQLSRRYTFTMARRVDVTFLFN
jgi:hypothetical protein